MNRRLSFAILAPLLCLSSAAAAQTTYDPALAYARMEGKAMNLYVANADGSRAVKLASCNCSINTVDFAPGGGRIAYGGQDGLRVVSYTASNAGVVVNSNVRLVSGTVGSVDFSADGTRILYSQADAFRAIAATGGASALLHTAVGLGPAHWLSPAEMGNAFAFLAAVPHGPNVPVDYEIRVVLMDGADQVTAVSTVLTTATQSFGEISDFDISRTRNALLVTVSYPTTMRFLDFDIGSSQLVDRGGPGQRGRYSTGDGAIYYREQVKGGYFLDRLDLGSGASTRLTAKYNIGPIDTRP